jgi:hypothetical protein
LRRRIGRYVRAARRLTSGPIQDHSSTPDPAVLNTVITGRNEPSGHPRRLQTSLVPSIQAGDKSSGTIVKQQDEARATGGSWSLFREA